MNDKYESWELGNNIEADSFMKNKFIFRDKEFWRSQYPQEFIDTEIEEGIYWKNYESIGVKNFGISTDSTDHFQFVCECCKRPAKIVDILTCLTDNMLTLKFSVFCIFCRKSGMRKIYLNDKNCIGQRILIDDKVHSWNGEKFKEI